MSANDSSTTTTTEAQNWTPPPAGSPCWIGIPAVDVQACKKFYAALFPSWQFKPATEKYKDDEIAMWSFTEPKGLTGGITKATADLQPGDATGKGSGVTIYHFVASIDETKKLIEQLGGKTVSEKHNEGDSGRYMHFLDTEGNKFGIYELVTK